MVFISYTTASFTYRSQELKTFRDALVRCSSEQFPMKGKTPQQVNSKASSSSISQPAPIDVNPLDELRTIALDCHFLCWDASKPLTGAKLRNFDILKDFKKLELIFVFGSESPMMSETFDLDLIPQAAWKDYHRRIQHEVNTRFGRGSTGGNMVPTVVFVKSKAKPGFSSGWLQAPVEEMRVRIPY